MTQDSPLKIRKAVQADLPAITAMLADDVLGATREHPGDAALYETAWRQIEAQSGNGVLVAELPEGVVGCLQLIVIPGLARQGALRAQIEGVRVASTHRGQDIGEHMIALPSTPPGPRVAASCNSPPTSAAPTRTASTSDWGSRPRTRA